MIIKKSDSYSIRYRFSYNFKKSKVFFVEMDDITYYKVIGSHSEE